MNFYDILFQRHNAKKIPYSKTYFDTLFAEKLKNLEIKTITGTLPLSFTAKGGNAVDWTIYGNDEGVGERTRNLFDEVYPNITGAVKYKPIYVGNGEFTLSTTAGRTNTDTTVLFLLAGNVSTGASSSYNGVANDKTQTVTAVDGYVTIGYRGYSYISPVNEHTMLNTGGTAEPYAPYGYQIPITVSQDGESDKSYDIFIGSAPLGEGETVSKTSTGIDIELFEGENTVSTTLTNKPEMTIKYK